MLLQDEHRHYIRKLREELGLSQQEAGRRALPKLKDSPARVRWNALETQTRPVSPKMLNQFLKVLGMQATVKIETLFVPGKKPVETVHVDFYELQKPVARRRRQKSGSTQAS